MVGMEREGPGMAMAFSGCEAEEVGGVLFPVAVVSWRCREVSNSSL